MSTLRGAAGFKKLVYDHIYSFLYSAVETRFDVRLKTLINFNCLQQHVAIKGFVYKGIVYSDPKGLPLRGLPRLANKLAPEMDSLIKEMEFHWDAETPTVMGYIRQVLNLTNYPPDCLKILPSVLHNTISNLGYPAELCVSKRVTDEQIITLNAQNSIAIMLLKKRMVLNLLE